METTKPDSKESVSAPAPDVLKVISTDEHAGKGGSYVFDPLTGKRTPSTTQEG